MIYFLKDFSIKCATCEQLFAISVVVHCKSTSCAVVYSLWGSMTNVQEELLPDKID